MNCFSNNIWLGFTQKSGLELILKIWIEQK
jgi:hypothetical protein